MSTMTAELIKLRNFERTLIKAGTTCLERLDQHEGSGLLDFLKELELKRKEEIYHLRCKMIAIYKPLFKVKDIVRKADIEKIDLKELKEEMLQIQKNIETLKKEAKERQEELKNEEIQLTEAVTAYEDKIIELEKPVDLKDYAIPVPKRISTSATNLCQEAKDYLHFVAKSGGHQNGWSVEDHSLFIKIRNNSKSTQMLAQNLHKILPDISEEEIFAHENWYCKYLELKGKHKAAIQSWRSTKNALSNNNTRKCVSAPLSRIKTRFPCNKTTKEDIQAWKNKREENFKKELEAKRLKELKQKESEEQRKKKNEELKREINQWKNSKLFKIQTEKMALELAQRQEKSFKAAQANKLIKQFQSQDDAYIKKKKMCAKARTKSEERVERKVVALRDPERVLKPTKNWLLKLKNDEDSKSREVPVCSVKNIERLHFPEWRKGIL